MSTYSSSIEIHCPPEKVFDLVADPQNMPQYLPTLHEAHSSGPDKVSMDGEAEGHPYHADGEFHVDSAARTMKWGSESNHKYRGELKVSGDEQHSALSVTLVFEAGQKMEEAVKKEKPDAEQMIQASLEQSLHSIKTLCEQR